MTPRDVVARAHGYVRAYDLQFADCFAEDGVLELPFAPGGMPRRIVGRDAIRRTLEPSYRAARASGRKILEYRDLRLLETSDREVVTVELTLVGAHADGTRYELPFVQVIRVRGGEIVEMRDYFDSLAMQSRLAPPPSGPSPRAVFEKFLAAVTEKRWSELPELYDEHAVVTNPLDVPVPSRHEGRDALRAHFATAAALPITLQVRNLVIHETTDPEVIVAEFDYLGHVATTNRTFQLPNVLVVRVRDGKIVTSRDYGNHVAFAHALGMLPAVLARLEG